MRIHLLCVAYLQQRARRRRPLPWVLGFAFRDHHQRRGERTSRTGIERQLLESATRRRWPLGGNADARCGAAKPADWRVRLRLGLYAVPAAFWAFASMNMGYGGEPNGGIYHPIYDDFYWYTHFSDSTFVTGCAFGAGRRDGPPRDSRAPTYCRSCSREVAATTHAGASTSSPARDAQKR